MPAANPPRRELHEENSRRVQSITPEGNSYLVQAIARKLFCPQQVRVAEEPNLVLLCLGVPLTLPFQGLQGLGRQAHAGGHLLKKKVCVWWCAACWPWSTLWTTASTPERLIHVPSCGKLQTPSSELLSGLAVTEQLTLRTSRPLTLPLELLLKMSARIEKIRKMEDRLQDMNKGLKVCCMQ